MFRTNHHWNFTKRYFLFGISLNYILFFLTSPISFQLSFFNMKINHGFNAICKISNPRLMRFNWIKFSCTTVFQIWFWSSIYIPENSLIATLFFPCSRNVLSFNFNLIWLVFTNTIRDSVLNKLIKWLDLLVNYTILIKKRINNFPLISFLNLIISLFSKSFRDFFTCKIWISCISWMINCFRVRICSKRRNF